MDDFRKIDELIKNAKITITPEEIEQHRKWLYQFYKDINYQGNIEEKANSVIEECLVGWKRASKNFASRIKQKVSGNLFNLWEKKKLRIKELKEQGKDEAEINRIVKEEEERDMRVRYEKRDGITDKERVVLKEKENDILREQVTITEDQYVLNDVYGSSIFDYLKADEKAYWKSRENDYKREFDFNESSDKILLEEAIYIEVLLRKKRIATVTGIDDETTQRLHEDELLENHRKILEKLGLLRVQRIQLDQNIEGNVSELSLLLDEKLTDIGKLSDPVLFKRTVQKIIDKYKTITREEMVDVLEEMLLLKEVEKMPVLNPVPQAIYQQIASDNFINKSIDVEHLNEIQPTQEINYELDDTFIDKETTVIDSDVT